MTQAAIRRAASSSAGLNFDPSLNPKEAYKASILQVAPLPTPCVNESTQGISKTRSADLCDLGHFPHDMSRKSVSQNSGI